MWTCLACGRKFKRRNQTHSCKSVSTVDDYIASFSDQEQAIMKLLRHIIINTAPNAEERMSWKMPTYYQNGNIIHFAMHQHHLGVYVGTAAITEFTEELSSVSYKKGTIHLQKDTAIPSELIQNIIQFNIRKHNNE